MIMINRLLINWLLRILIKYNLITLLSNDELKCNIDTILICGALHLYIQQSLNPFFKRGSLNDKVS